MKNRKTIGSQTGNSTTNDMSFALKGQDVAVVTPAEKKDTLAFG